MRRREFAKSILAGSAVIAMPDIVRRETCSRGRAASREWRPAQLASHRARGVRGRIRRAECHACLQRSGQGIAAPI